jgi:hypothetical protein
MKSKVKKGRSEESKSEESRSRVMNHYQQVQCQAVTIHHFVAAGQLDGLPAAP